MWFFSQLELHYVKIPRRLSVLMYFTLPTYLLDLM